VRKFRLKVDNWNLKIIFYEHYRSIFNHCDIIGLQAAGFGEKKRKIRAIAQFKVIQNHRGRYQSYATFY